MFLFFYIFFHILVLSLNSESNLRLLKVIMTNHVNVGACMLKHVLITATTSLQNRFLRVF